MNFTSFFERYSFVGNEILIYRNLSILNSISQVKSGLNLKYHSGLKISPDSCKLPPKACSFILLDSKEAHKSREYSSGNYQTVFSGFMHATCVA